MIDNLTEAIAHAKEAAKENREMAKKFAYGKNNREACLDCAKEQEQIATYLEQLLAITLLYEEYKEYGGGFHYQVGRVFDGDYVLDNNGSEPKECEGCKTPLCDGCKNERLRL